MQYVAHVVGVGVGGCVCVCVHCVGGGGDALIVDTGIMVHRYAHWELAIAHKNSTVYTYGVIWNPY